MIRITVKGEALDLPQDFSLDIEESSPVFNDTGSASISVELPATDRNRRIFGFPARPDSIGAGMTRGVRCQVLAGAYSRTGVLNVDSASAESIGVNIGFDNSIAYEAWKAKALSKVEALPCYKIPDLYEFSKFIADLYYRGRPKEDDLAVFPVCVACETLEKDGVETDYPEIINKEGFEPFYYPQNDGRTVVRLIDNEPTQVTVPYGYGCSPFVKVWKVLECVFSDLGLAVDRNPFRENLELARLVVLNNTADAVCNKTLDYAELMPDCTVEDFLQALFVRFGMVYRTDFDTGTAYIRLLRDIAGTGTAVRLDGYLSAPPDYEYRTPQYVRLSAGSSIEGAAPMTDRLEDFLKGYGQRTIYVGVCPGLWVSGSKQEGYLGVVCTGSAAAGRPSGDVPEHVPSPIDQYCQAIPRSEKPDTGNIGYSWNPTTGQWFRNSSFNGQRTCEESSSFFIWDPQPEGFDSLDLDSPDEWCPVGTIITRHELIFGPVREAMPMFRVGARHFHTYLENESGDRRGDCPLSFMFALTGFCGKDETVGRLSADVGLDNHSALFSDGSTHDISLYFQFRNGLYAKFWKDYDMMLRNADRWATLTGKMDRTRLLALDPLAPVSAGGVRALIDRIDLTLGESRETEFEMTVVPAVPHPDGKRFEVESTDFPHEHVVL